MEYMLVRCEGCTLGTCAVKCNEDALILVAGNLLMVTQKCSVCDRYKGFKLPDCIAGCSKSAVKVIVEQKSTGAKRESAAWVNSLFM